VIRRVLFWCHLACGVLAAAVILIMSITGVVLTYQRQMQWWADTRHYRAAPADDDARLPLDELVARVSTSGNSEAVVTSLVLRSDPTMPAALSIGGRTVFANPHTGRVYGEGTGAGLRRFFSSMVSWHRYVALTGGWRPFGKAVTGASNLIFLFIVMSGMCLWLPRVWTWAQVRAVVWFRRSATPKARDFNWHNVIGIWSSIPLAIVVASATVISYPWASNLVYRAAGEAPPASGRGSGPGPGASRGTNRVTGTNGRHHDGRPVGSLDRAAAMAAARLPGWRIMTIRPPASATAPIVVTVDEGDGGQPQLRGTLTLDPGRPDTPRWEHFRDQSTGRQWRSWLRFAHTGEVYGLTGQTVAGLVSAGGVFLVWTGLALTLRRFAAWRRRRERATVP
jgi:uncharacterized iron-regulated membrane protein